MCANNIACVSVCVLDQLSRWRVMPGPNLFVFLFTLRFASKSDVISKYTEMRNNCSTYIECFPYIYK